MEEIKATMPNPETETTAEVKIPQERTFKQIADWLKEWSDGNLELITKDGKFELHELAYDKVLSAKKRATRVTQQGEMTDIDTFELMLISDSLVKPVMGELDIKKLKGSTVIKLKSAISKLYDLQSFLSV